MMTTLSSPAPMQRAASIRSPLRSTAALMLLTVGAFLVALGTLGAAINWPQSLQYPASQMLPLLAERLPTVLIGYSAYLLSAVLLIPMTILLQRALDPQRTTTVLTIATAFGVLSGIAKPLGILRWLEAMPTLARAYTDAAAPDATRQTIGIVYETLNAYAGSLGEVVGVALFGGLWATLVGVALLRMRRLPVFGWSGIAVGLLSLLPIVQIYGIELGPVLTVSNAAWYLWVLAFGIRLWTVRSTQEN